MAFFTRIGFLLGPGRSADILLYVHMHPGCRISAIYSDVTRNAHTRDRIDALEREGLLEVVTIGHGCLLRTTEKGERVAGMLESLESVLQGPRSSDDTDGQSSIDLSS